MKTMALNGGEYAVSRPGHFAHGKGTCGNPWLRRQRSTASLGKVVRTFLSLYGIKPSLSSPNSSTEVTRPSSAPCLPEEVTEREYSHVKRGLGRLPQPVRTQDNALIVNDAR
jgi:hypothetical protein